MGLLPISGAGTIGITAIAGTIGLTSIGIYLLAAFVIVCYKYLTKPATANAK